MEENQRKIEKQQREMVNGHYYLFNFNFFIPLLQREQLLEQQERERKELEERQRRDEEMRARQRAEQELILNKKNAKRDKIKFSFNAS